ncbi:MAG: hypothetical protein KAT00_01640 [Planctomycetes bacterium]|nr:hypothetical protein [Planctomycetota bacterium]
MNERNEIVVVDLSTSVKMRIFEQISSRMETMGHDPANLNSLDLGFDVPQGWPIDINTAPTMSQLVVLANKLKMRITVLDINLAPLE